MTVRNEARHISDLLDSLVVQEPPVEIVIVDAASTDGTPDIVRRYADQYGFIRLFEDEADVRQAADASSRRTTSPRSTRR